ncbi:MAG: hypothetical protein PVG49_12965 [Desulfobacteraceae bacterium]|jgi:hypothetical protein
MKPGSEGVAAPLMNTQPVRSLRPKRQRFGGKIILLVLAIIAVSQALGTFLSVLSFEDIYLKALLSKYEILGKDLNRKIEQALKFGKPLDRLLGVDRLAEGLFRQAEELEEASVFDLSGRPLFSFKKVEFVLAKGVVDEQERSKGKVLMASEEEVETRYIGDLKDRQEPWPLVQLTRGKYRLLFPIKPPFGARQGYLELAFGKSVLDVKTWELIRHSITKGILAVVLSGLAAALLIRFLFVNPARRQVRWMEAAVFKDPESASPVMHKPRAPEEMLQVQQSMEAYVAMAKNALDEVRSGLLPLERTTPENAHTAHVIRLMKQVLAGDPHEDV